MSPIVVSGNGAPGLAQTCPGALGVTNSLVEEGKDAGRVRRGTSHCPALLGHILHRAGGLAVEVAVLPPVGQHLLLPVDLSGAPRPLGAPGQGALLVSDALVDEGKHTDLT